MATVGIIAFDKHRQPRRKPLKIEQTIGQQLTFRIQLNPIGVSVFCFTSEAKNISHLNVQ